MTAWILLAAALLLIVACGVFVAAEFSFVTVDRSKVDQAASEGDAGARGLQQALRSLSTQLSGAQVGITITNLAIGFLAEPAIATLIDGPLTAAGLPQGAVAPVAVGIGLVVGTILTMIFGELVPKNLALAKPMEVARATQRFQRAFTAINRIPIRILNGSANAFVRRLGIEPQEELRSARSSTELASLIQRSADQGTLDADTAELMERSVEFGSRTAGEIMTPRVRTVSLEVNDRASDVLELARQTGHSRFPVLDTDESVVGTVHLHADADVLPGAVVVTPAPARPDHQGRGVVGLGDDLLHPAAQLAGAPQRVEQPEVVVGVQGRGELRAGLADPVPRDGGAGRHASPLEWCRRLQ